MTKEGKETKKFKCKYPGCDAEFDRTIDLARHVRTEHKLKPTATPMPTGAPTPAATPTPDVHGVKGEKGGKIVPAAEEGKKEEGAKNKVEAATPNVSISTPPPEKVDMTSGGVRIGPKPLHISPPAEEVKEIENKYEPLLLSYPEVTGVGVGRTTDGRAAIEVLVCKKCAEHEDIPKFLDGIPVVIHEVGKGNAVEAPAGEQGPERKETLIDKVAHAKKLGVFFEGPIRKSLRKWLKRRREAKTGGRER